MKVTKFAIPLATGLAIALSPMPEGVTAQGWNLLAIFVATIVGLIVKPLPLGAVALFSMVLSVVTHTMTLPQALSGFSSPVIWLVVLVFFIARAFIKTQLGTRIAYFFVSLFGRSTLGLGYGIITTELLIAPVIPSNAARAGGVMYPILKSIAEALGSRPEDGTAKKLGGFLTQVCFHGNLITSAMFLTAMAANPMAQVMAKDQSISITWMNWFLGALVPGLACLILVPLLLFMIYPPEVKYLPEAKGLAKLKLQDMGPMKRDEWVMLGVFLFMLFFWISGEHWGIDSTTTAMMGVSLLILSRVLTWDDILQEHEAWHILIWFAILVTMAKHLQLFGVVDWFSQYVGSHMHGMDWVYVFIGLMLTYFYSHYFFASNTAHVGAMYPAFLAVAIGAGAPPLLAALVLGYFSNLFSAMTHYGSGSSVVLYGSGYVPIGQWWKLGFIVSVVNLFIWFGVGGIWWKFLGMW